METDVNPYMEIERSRNGVELGVENGESWICDRRSGVCNCGIDIAAELGIKSNDTGTKQK